MSTQQVGQPDMSGWSVSKLREYAERVSQEAGMATVLVAMEGQVHEYVMTSAELSRYTDAETGALAEALFKRQEQVLS